MPSKLQGRRCTCGRSGVRVIAPAPLHDGSERYRGQAVWLGFAAVMAALPLFAVLLAGGASWLADSFVYLLVIAACSGVVLWRALLRDQRISRSGINESRG